MEMSSIFNSVSQARRVNHALPFNCQSTDVSLTRVIIRQKSYRWQMGTGKLNLNLHSEKRQAFRTSDQWTMVSGKRDVPGTQLNNRRTRPRNSKLGNLISRVLFAQPDIGKNVARLGSKQSGEMIIFAPIMGVLCPSNGGRSYHSVNMAYLHYWRCWAAQVDKFKK